jgi:hypothetical protein
MAGYHLREIEKGVVGELSKIYEEVEEIKDSAEQGVDIMLLVELSDLVGAVQLYLRKHHPSITLEDLVKMSNVTQRAFETGGRE